MSQPAPDRNVTLGILAVQLQFITPDALAAVIRGKRLTLKVMPDENAPGGETDEADADDIAADAS